MSRPDRTASARRTDPRSRWARRRQEAGYAALLVCMLTAAVFIPVAALAVDVSRWYVEIQRVQNAADAAATAGVTYLPSDLDSAEDTAISVAARNGYPNSGSTSVKVELGSKPTQLKVTVSSRIRNSLAGYFNADFATIERSAVADYNGPAPMGSPCNTFGNEPSGALTPDVNRGPRGSVIVVPPGGATCTSAPQFWGAIAGPDTPKGNGDAYMTRTCSSGQSNCSGSTNSDFDPTGYFYMVRVGAAAVGTDVTVQIYDPAFVQVGDSCGDGPKTTTALKDNMSVYTPQDGKDRYAPGAGTAFCNGDVLNGGNASDLITSFVLRSPTDTYQPKLAPAMPNCEKQYPGYDSNATKSEVVDSSTTKYREDVAKVFRQWVDLCTFRPTAEGDYYLQVRTNVKLGGLLRRRGRLHQQLKGVGADRRRHVGEGQRQQPLVAAGARTGPGRGLDRGLRPHGCVRQLQRLAADLQPGPGGAGRGHQDAQDRLLRRRRRLEPGHHHHPRSVGLQPAGGPGQLHRWRRGRDRRPGGLSAQQRVEQQLQRQVAVRERAHPGVVHLQRQRHRWLLVPGDVRLDGQRAQRHDDLDRPHRRRPDPAHRVGGARAGSPPQSGSRRTGPRPTSRSGSR
ncbi:hypothetical protein G5V58_05920 [Nocardioides anomalus]|uniref:Putative Flp pilus-assembly TadG-like N-terminal domain-containing protein n=1 Tax=Nocardioides anomalus TaxID=2712223 RepID=A0A6G6WB33_9ACTN|nr:pilus assembly protein TadG-related protein [Nocardioides anomalus]QIG42367.1 hypothetical protein G5V58_05920 [Nocardioides anomalus]